MEALVATNIPTPLNRVATINCLESAEKEARNKLIYRIAGIASIILGGTALVGAITASAVISAFAPPIGAILVPIAVLALGLIVYKRVFKNIIYTFCINQSHLAAEREVYFRGAYAQIEAKKDNEKFRSLPPEYQTVIGMYRQCEETIKMQQQKHNEIEAELKLLTQETLGKPFSPKTAAKTQRLMEQKFAIEARYLIPAKVQAAYLMYTTRQDLMETRELADFGHFNVPSAQADINNQALGVDPVFFQLATQNKGMTKANLLAWSIEKIANEIFIS